MRPGVVLELCCPGSWKTEMWLQVWGGGGRGMQGGAERGRKRGEENAKPRCGRGKMHEVGPTQFRDTHQHPRVIQG